MIQEQKEIDDRIDDIESIDLKIYELQKTIAPKIEELTARKREIEDVLNTLIMREAMKQLSQNDYGCGTANIETMTHKIKAVVSKKIKWDEGKLRNIAEQIRSAGQDPETYISYKALS